MRNSHRRNRYGKHPATTAGGAKYLQPADGYASALAERHGTSVASILAWSEDSQTSLTGDNYLRLMEMPTAEFLSLIK